MNGSTKKLFKCNVTGNYLLKTARGLWFVLRGDYWQELRTTEIVTSHLALIGKNVRFKRQR